MYSVQITEKTPQGPEVPPPSQKSATQEAHDRAASLLHDLKEMDRDVKEDDTKESKQLESFEKALLQLEQVRLHRCR